MAKLTLFPDPTCLHLKLVDASTTIITFMLTATSPEGNVPSVIDVRAGFICAICAWWRI